MAKYEKQTTRIPLDLKGIKNKATAKDLVSEFVIGAIQEDMDSQRSSVNGQRWKSLTSKEYIKIKGSGTANLKLNGDLRSSLKSKRRRGGELEIGIFASGQQGKSEGHNQFDKSKAKKGMPRRQFIPNDEFEENFRKGITTEVRNILDLLRDDKGLEGALGRILGG